MLFELRRFALVARVNLLLLAVAPVIAFGALTVEVDPDPVELTGTAGSTTPQTATATVSNDATASVDFTASVTTQSGGDWLSVDPRSGTIAAQGSVELQISANSSQLNPGTYDGDVTIKGDGSPLTVHVTFHVQGTRISVAPNKLAFSLTPGQTASKTFTITESTQTGATVDVVPSAPWITVDKTSTAVPDTIKVTVNAAGMQVGSSPTENVSVSCTGTPCIPQSVAVTLNVMAALSLSVSPSQVSLTRANSFRAQAQLIAAGGSTSFTIDKGDANWLTVTPSATSVSPGGAVSLTLTGSPAGLSAGDHSTNVTFSGSGVKATLGVTITVPCSPSITSGAPTPTATVGQSYVFTFTAAGCSPPYRWSASSGLPSSLTLDPATGVLSGVPSSPALFTFTITVQEAGGGTTTATYTIQVQAAAPDITASPLVLRFTLIAGQTATAQNSFSVSAKSGRPTVSITPATDDGANWLAVNKMMTVPPDVITVTVNAVNLKPGGYTGTVSLQCAGCVSLTVVTVTLKVSASATLSANPPQVNLSAVAGSTAAKNAIVALTGSPGGTFRAGTSGESWLSVTPSSDVLVDNSPYNITITANPTGLDVRNYSGSVTISTDGAHATINVTFTITSPQLSGPVINAITAASAFSTTAGIASGTYVEIYGSNLTTETRTWADADFSGTHAPTKLGDVSVSVNGKAAFVSYVSPAQVNVQMPDDAAVGGGIPVVLTNSAGESPPFLMQKSDVAPALWAPSLLAVAGKQYVGAFLNGEAHTLAGPEGVRSGYVFHPAAPGDVIVMYGIGFGPVTPAVAAGDRTTSTTRLTNEISFLVGQVLCHIDYAGLVPPYVGLYQFNVIVPAVGPGDQAITVQLGGRPIPQQLFITTR